MKKVNIGALLLTALLVMAGITVFAVYALGSGAGKSGTFSYAKTSGEEVHVNGRWVQRDKAVYDGERDIFEFYMQDSTAQTALVHYPDTKPQNFETADKIEIVGKFEGEVFKADKIYMKCPSKYEGGESGGMQTSAQNPAP